MEFSNGIDIAKKIRMFDFERIQDQRFLKSHKSFIVNMDYITKIEKASITIIDDTKIPNLNNMVETEDIYLL
jgi:DNA-binding LytR/AlgR family response regulator